MPDASRITPPVLEPGQRSGHDIALSLTIDGGVPIQELRSPSHAVEIGRADARHATVRLKPFETIPNRDFVLDFQLAGSEPEFAVLAHRDPAGAGYFSALLVPAAQPAPRDVMAKELIFVVDCSGSMRGEPMAKAKQAMRHALKNMGPNDYFQIIRFSTQASGFRPQPVPATAANIRDGLRYVEQMAGGGGTQMIEGIKAALDYQADSERLRIVAFMTDGYIGNESQILAAIRQRLGGARLFSFGVGSSVNRYLLDRMAEVGRGAVENVLLGADTQEVVERFYNRVRSPYLTDLTIDWGGLEVVDQYPTRVNDLFLGQTLRLAGRYEKPGKAMVTVRGRLGGRPWERRYEVELPARTEGRQAIGTLWARARIRDLMGRELPAPGSEIVEQVTELGITHQLMTAYTSFVAVEERIEVVGGQSRTVTVPVEMPEGVSYEGVFGDADGYGEGDRVMGSLKKGAQVSTWGSVRSQYQGGRSRMPAAVRTLPGAQLPPVANTPGGETREQEAVELTSLMAPPDAMSRQAIQAVLHADRTEVRAGDSITLTLEIRNSSNTALKLPWPLAAGLGQVELTVVDGDWNTVELRTGAVQQGTSVPAGTGEYQLAPQTSITITIELPSAGRQAQSLGGYVLPGAGTYHVGVLRIGGFEVVSNQLTLRVAR